jgi:uncharacterized protein Yka (UPF0111/DUF47 family)
VTPIEREDIYNLASSLDDIVDLAEEVADKIDLYKVSQVTPQARAIGENLAQAGSELMAALKDLEGFGHL